ncbi:hypothetical protein Nepgr_002091 [Nepenthes gracilis]|uniref:J domain-containing protein n=1 Tax=Nepenthes gracilis TaxID=150966 RepID=A0AAD3P6G8_NEPGR|nr:hypothetical protein Nepgr_002091 [Nepenthes gracilis]
MEGAGTISGAGVNRAEAERLLGIAEKLLQTRDLTGSREFAVLAQETEPLLEGSDQILAISDVFLASEKRINNQYDWYSILGVERRTEDADLIKKNYRRLALLLHPDKNKFPHSDAAFKLVSDAWSVLSDQSKKSLYDNELSLFSRVELGPKWAQAPFQQQNKLRVRKNARGAGESGTSPNAARCETEAGGGGGDNRSSSRLSSFWTTCPYCYLLYEYPRMYEGCCLRCHNCQRGFHAALVPSLPPLVPGKEAYYCCWGFFPLGFSIANLEAGKNPNFAFPNCMPPMNSGVAPATAAAPVSAGAEDGRQGREGLVDIADGNASANLRHAGTTPPKKRGRPRKNLW